MERFQRELRVREIDPNFRRREAVAFPATARHQDSATGSTPKRYGILRSKCARNARNIAAGVG